MRRLSAMCAFLALAGTAWAGEFRLDPSITAQEILDLTEAVADVIVLPNVGPAEPGGITGFDVLAVAGGPQVDTDDSWWINGVDGDTTAGVFYGSRIVARKGLPFGLDVGAQVGKVMGEQFWGADLKWAFLPGGAISPAVALRASYSRMAGDVLDVEVAEAQAVISKGFAMLTPYAALGYRRVEGSAEVDDGGVVVTDVEKDRVTGAVGIRLSLVPLRIVAEVRQGWDRGAFIGVGVGL